MHHYSQQLKVLFLQNLINTIQDVLQIEVLAPDPVAKYY